MEQAFTNQRKKTWIPQRERIWVFLSIGIATLIFLIGVWNMFNLPANAFHTRVFKSLFKNYGSLARICLFFVLANYVLILVLHKRIVNRWNTLKNGVVLLSRFARRWHTPIAIIAIGLILLHVVGAFLYGFKFDFNNITGLLALLILLPVPVSGLLRYRRMDRKWHLRLGLGFSILFLIHAFL
jgi:hypothetical protein